VIGVERKFVVTDIFLVYRVHVGGEVYRVHVGGGEVYRVHVGVECTGCMLVVKCTGCMLVLSVPGVCWW
jgi:hypothetical protein